MGWLRGTVGPAVAACLLGSVVGCGNEAAPSPSAPAGTAIAQGRLEAQAVEMSSDDLVFDDVAVVEDSVVVLASSTNDREGGVVLRSDDGGVSWSQGTTPLDGLLSGPHSRDWALAADRPHLLPAGRRLVATRTVEVGEQLDTADSQAVVLSADRGETWRELALPVPAGTTALVHDALAVGDVLLLAGATQRLGSTAAGGYSGFEERRSAYDAALWRSSDGGTSFERVAAPQLDDQPDAQVIRHLVAFDGRVIAIGGDSRTARPGCCFIFTSPVAWESGDGGTTWTSMSGLEVELPNGQDAYGAPVETPGALVLELFDASLQLDAGSSQWRGVPVPDGWPPTAGAAQASAAGAVTWVEAVACDCSVAHAGRVDGGRLVSSAELPFHDCVDESLRGDTRVEDPVALGAMVAALASCDHHGQGAASIAWTADGGTTWDTERLTPLAATVGGTELLVPGAPAADGFAAVDDQLLLVLVAPHGQRIIQAQLTEPARLVAVIVRPSA